MMVCMWSVVTAYICKAISTAGDKDHLMLDCIRLLNNFESKGQESLDMCTVMMQVRCLVIIQWYDYGEYKEWSNMLHELQ